MKTRIAGLFTPVLGCAVLAVASHAHASDLKSEAQLPAARSGALEISAERLERLDRVLQRYVGEERIMGAVALVLKDGQTVYERAVGWSDKESGRKMGVDTIFRIASQTKALTSVAILSLMEQGELGLNTPVSEFIEGFAGAEVAVQANGVTKFVPVKRTA